MKTTDIKEFLQDPALRKGTDTLTALAILTRMATTNNWDPLARFYRKNLATIETVGPAP
jgi:ethanolamine utilization cobalamin adenosyltransferase